MKQFNERFCGQVESLLKRVKFLSRNKKVLIAFTIAIIAILLLYHASWSGFGEDTIKSTEKSAKGEIQKTTETIQSAKTLWDWLELSGVLAIPVLLAILGYQFQRREQERAAEILRDEALQAYLDSMSVLLLDKDLSTADNEAPVRDVARVKTLTILRRLDKDGERKEIVMRFLIDANLISGDRKLDLDSANLSNVILEDAILSDAILREADLSDAILSGANLSGANLSNANLSNAILSDTNLSGADLSGADLSGADLSGADLSGAILNDAILNDAILEEAKNLKLNSAEVIS